MTGQLTRAMLEDAMEAMWSQSFRPPPPILVHPRTAHGLRLWLRWTHWLAVFDISLWPRRRRWMPWFVWRAIAHRRQRHADAHFGRLLERYPWRPR